LPRVVIDDLAGAGAARTRPAGTVRTRPEAGRGDVERRAATAKRRQNISRAELEALERVPAMNATRCLPSTTYVITPPPGAPGRSVFQRTLPVSASNAYACSSMSPAKTRPPLVGVTPESTGALA